MVLVGRLKIPYQDLFYLTLDELNLIREGHEIEKRDDWERMRVASYNICGPYLKKGTSIRNFMQFPWDEVEAVEDLVSRAKEKLRKLKQAQNVS